MSEIKLGNRGLSCAITSREYKLILHPQKISDHEKYADAFWKEIKTIIKSKLGGEIVKEQSEIKIKTTKYLDTKDNLLRKNNFILRHRKNHDDDNFKTTLKYRSSDRYLSSDTPISNNRDTEIKFEEDILFNSRKYSLSASYIKSKNSKINNLYDICDNFPLKRVLNLANNTTFKTVNKFKAHEITRWLGKIRFNNGHKVKFCINYWFEKEGEYDHPILAELAFDYDLISSSNRKKGYVWSNDTVESFHIPTVQAVHMLFIELKRNKKIDPQGSTKTNYVYSL